MSPRRVVHVVRQFLPVRGGLEEFVAKLAGEQIANGASVRVVTCDASFRERGRKLAGQDVIDGIDIVRVPFRGSTRYPLAPSVLKHIRDADIVHVHAVDFFFDFLALTRGLHRKPLIATTHGGFFHTSAYGAIKRIWFNTVTRTSVRRYRAIAACSQSDFDMFANLSPGNLHLVENGVDVEKFSGAASPAAVKRLVAVGRFSVNKRLDRLLDAMRELVRRDRDWRLDIIGLESDWTLHQLQEAVEKRRLKSSVNVLVNPSDDTIGSAFGSASFFVSASEFEGFGLALVEGLSAGLSAVVHPNAAFAGLSEKYGSIRLADFAKPGEAADCIEAAWSALVNGPEDHRARAMSVAANFAWPRVARAYDEIYDRVIAGTAAPLPEPKRPAAPESADSRP